MTNPEDWTADEVDRLEAENELLDELLLAAALLLAVGNFDNQQDREFAKKTRQRINAYRKNTP